MSIQYDVLIGGKVYGPFDVQKVRQLIAQRILHKNSEVRIGEEKWSKLGKIDLFFGKDGNPVPFVPTPPADIKTEAPTPPPLGPTIVVRKDLPGSSNRRKQPTNSLVVAAVCVAVVLIGIAFLAWRNGGIVAAVDSDKRLVVNYLKKSMGSNQWKTLEWMEKKRGFLLLLDYEVFSLSSIRGPRKRNADQFCKDESEAKAIIDKVSGYKLLKSMGKPKVLRAINVRLKYESNILGFWMMKTSDFWIVNGKVIHEDPVLIDDLDEMKKGPHADNALDEIEQTTKQINEAKKSVEQLFHSNPRVAIREKESDKVEAVKEEPFSVVIEGELPPGIGVEVEKGVFELHGEQARRIEYSAIKEFAASPDSELQNTLRTNWKRNKIGICLSLLLKDEKDLQEHTDSLLVLDRRLREIIPLDMASYSSVATQEFLPLYRLLGNATSRLARTTPEAKAVFDERIRLLRDSPIPHERMRAAMGLYGAEGVSDAALPTLIHAIDNDVSLDVRLACAVSLGGFLESKDLAEKALVRKLGDATKDYQRQIVVWALADLDPKSAVVRKCIRECFDAHRRQGYELTWALDFLTKYFEHGKLVTRNLIKAAEIQLDRHGEIKPIGEALLAVASDDERVLNFFQKQARTGPNYAREYCDSLAKRLHAMQEAQKQEVQKDEPK